MNPSLTFTSLLAVVFLSIAGIAAAQDQPRFPDPINVDINPIGSDESVKWDYPITYVRAQ
ncbi:MAG: hypothetical protein ACI8XO_000704 [Verrucomicrobiales bacterium]|jgi:hypothetical protein